MEIPTSFKRNDVFMVKVQMASQFTCIVSKPGAVVSGIGIAGFDTESEGEENSFGIL